MIEIRELVHDVFTAAGWSLAAWQYWRNELNKRPLIVLEGKRARRAPSTANVAIAVRNRGPWDIFCKQVKLVKPSTAELVFRDKRGNVEYRGKAAPLSVHLPAAASGSFPSAESQFFIESLSPSNSQVMLRFTIEESRSRAFSKRPLVRHQKRVLKI
jgi:hypothetical protein